MNVVVILLTVLGFVATYFVGTYYGHDSKERKKYWLKPPMLYGGIAVAVVGALAAVLGPMFTRPYGMSGMPGGGMMY